MKFINYLSSIAGIGIFPMISLLIFFTFFVLLGLYIIKADRKRFKYLAALPVDEMSSTETDDTNRTA
jgi:hypothetical protein